MVLSILETLCGGQESAQVRKFPPCKQVGKFQDANAGCLVVIGEVCNFAAYAFAPAILVTPLGALAVLVGAVLGSYFLKEELGTLGKLGSAICLIGAVIIVLHAPADEDIETIEQILEYALQPGMPGPLPLTDKHISFTDLLLRLPAILSRRLHICRYYDLQGGTGSRKEESAHLPWNLLDCGISLGHVYQGLRDCTEVNVRRKQPVFSSFHLCVHDHHHGLHPGANELL